MHLSVADLVSAYGVVSPEDRLRHPPPGHPPGGRRAGAGNSGAGNFRPPARAPPGRRGAPRDPPGDPPGTPPGTPLGTPREGLPREPIYILFVLLGPILGGPGDPPWGPPWGPPRAPPRGAPRAPPPGGQKSAHFFGYLITLPVGTVWATFSDPPWDSPVVGQACMVGGVSVYGVTLGLWIPAHGAAISRRAGRSVREGGKRRVPVGRPYGQWVVRAPRKSSSLEARTEVRAGP